MKKTTLATVLGTVLLLGGCYHAIIETGLTPSGQKISQPWAMSYVAGLIPPPIVNAAAKCPDGVARIETQHTFLNSVVSILTWSIITPIRIDVECAAKKTSALDGAVLKAGDRNFEQVVTEAVRTSQRTGEAVYIEY
jgi:hypothetical protein